MCSEAALISFDLTVAAILVGDFLLVTRPGTRIVSPWPPVLMLLAAVAHFALVSSWDALGPAEFVTILITVSAGSLVAYYNFVAFSKRGITFAILRNHSRPPQLRVNDEEFIDLQLRLEETQRNGWVVGGLDGYRLTRKGKMVAWIYRRALSLLQAETIG
jgi:hypothetical protein